MKHPKIEPSQLARSAYIYVRQSTKHQVEHHLESQQRQYELKARATELGWREECIIVIDQDLGTSASGNAHRTGFERLVADVALGRAGIVLGLEVSRLARNNRDWYELLDLCAVKRTLIGDTDGVYDPATYNDRLLLGLKGTMSEAELHLIKTRMIAGLRHKAAKGELRFLLPAGYEYDNDKIVKTSDEEVIHFIELVFRKVLEEQSVNCVLRYILHEGLHFPRRDQPSGSIRWVKPYYRAVHLMVTNPIYAGAYVWGRNEWIQDIAENGTRRKRLRVKSVAEWNVVLHDHHAAFISWQDYERIQQMVERNRPVGRSEASLALREGVALLQGIVRCGNCGRPMTVRYQSGPNKTTTPTYNCIAAFAQHRSPPCQVVGGRRIEQAVSGAFLEVMSEGHLEFHLAALRKLDEPEDVVIAQLELELERARYEAGRLERQYNTVEPENRVVARTLEGRWNDALAHVEELEQRLEKRRSTARVRLTDDAEVVLKKLSAKLPTLWTHESVDERDRKALLRAAIDEVQLSKENRVAHVKIIWKGGATSALAVKLQHLPTIKNMPSDVVQLVRELAALHSDIQIARILNARRMRTPRSNESFTAHHVSDLRRRHAIPNAPDRPKRGHSKTYTVEQAARLFKVSPPTIYSWLKLGLLVGEQIAAGAPWAIRITDADQQRLAREAPKNWLPLGDAAAELAVSKQTILNWVKAGKIPCAYVHTGRRRGLRIDVKSAPQRRQQRLLD